MPISSDVTHRKTSRFSNSHPPRISIDVTTRASSGRSFIRVRCGNNSLISDCLNGGNAKAWSCSIALPINEDIEEIRQFVKQRVKPVMKAFGSTITTKWEAYEFLQRLLLSRGYGESRALAVIEECERKSMDAHLQTPTDLMHMVNEAVTPFGGPIEVIKGRCCPNRCSLNGTN